MGHLSGRRPLLFAALSAALSFGALPFGAMSSQALAAGSATTAPSVSPAAGLGSKAERPGGERAAKAALNRAIKVRAGTVRGDYTLELLEVWKTKDHLPAADRQVATRLLARPTDGVNDPSGDGYSVPEAAPVCGVSTCVHYVTASEDAVPPVDGNGNGLPDQVDLTLQVADQSVAFQTGQGYRPPLPDAVPNGDPRLDVYLVELGSQQLNGYCSAEQLVTPTTVNGYCVFDNDFAHATVDPVNQLRGTGTHEIFHAVQFAYDAFEDRWMFESSSEWMEEQFADDANANLGALSYGQLGAPYLSLDTYDDGGYVQYGNWAWPQFLTERFGAQVVRQAWEAAAQPGVYSLPAYDQALVANGSSLDAAYRAFTVTNADAKRGYAEGKQWGKPRYSRKYTFYPGTRVKGPVKINHLASYRFLIKPAKRLHKGRITMKIKLPRGFAGQVSLTTLGKKKSKTKVVRINKRGLAKAKIKVKRKKSKRRPVVLTLTNPSWAMVGCGSNKVYACGGVGASDRVPFKMFLKARGR